VRPAEPAAAGTPPDSEPLEFPEVEPRIESLIEFEAELETIEEELPRPRGRDAIRARGGDRPAGRPRERERIRSIEPPAGEPLEHPRPSEPAANWGPAEPRLTPEREPRGSRSVSAEGEAPTRGRAHGRAGEPGYVPRRERTRGSSEPTAEPARASGDWPGAPVEPPTAELLGPTEDQAGPRRRRRRRRRTERDPRGAGTSPAGRPELFDDLLPEQPDESSLDFEDDEPAAAPPRPPAARRPLGPAAMLDRGDELSDLHDDFPGEAGPASAEFETELLHDEEIDPELEEEIRREIEEIQILEREMGLRGTTEARPRRGDESAEVTPRGERPRGRGPAKPPIQEVFRRGDEVLIQVIKESIGTKGPTLSTYISIPGRYLVLMPGLNRVGVSRKIADEGQRRRLREIMHALNPPKGLGFIVRTAGLDRTKRELARDLAYLLRLWKVILKRIKKTKAPAPIYQESDMIIRTIRDIFTVEIDTIWIDERSAYERAVEFMKVVMPKHVDRVKFYDERVPLFHKYGLEEEIAKIQRRRVDLHGGGSIVIDQTEALVAIDVNSGNFRVEDDAEKTAYEMNLRAAKEIARQLRLRDLGGVIVNDFIDMRDEKHRRSVERAVRDAMKRDRARTKILRMSQFGIIEMTRQRIRPSLKRSVYEDCPHCAGAGVVKTAESMAIDVMRLLALVAHRADVRRVHVSVAPSVATYLNNRKRREIAQIETESNLLIVLRHQESAAAEHLAIECFDAQNNEIRLFPAPQPAPRRGR
jgi:ribonuclease E